MTYKEPLYFIAGAAVGATVAVFAVKRKYEKYANDQIEECRHGYNYKLYELSQQNRNKPPLETVAEPEKAKQDDIVEDYAEDDDPEEAVIAEVGPDISLIDDNEFAYNNRYDKQTVIIYADGTLARDDNDDVIDVSKTIGPDAYEKALHNPDPDEAVYVRNETEEMDYEIILSNKTYTEATGVFLKGID